MMLCLLCIVLTTALIFVGEEIESPEPPPAPPSDVEADAFGIDIVDVTKAKYTYAEMVDDLSLLKARYGERMSYRSIGTSLDGRAIYAVTLGNPNAERQIVISAGIHAREYMTPMLVMAQLEHYLYYYDTESYEGTPLSELFEEYAICILPMCNPDGITLAEEGLDGIRSEELKETILSIYELDRVKFEYTGTLDEYLSEWKANARGVDLNRNFDTDDFGTYPTMSRPCFMNHPGEYPLSEPETIALTEYVKSLKNPVLSVAVHSQGEVIYFNCGQDNFDEARALSESLASLTGYKLELDERHDSAFDDWCNKALGIPSATIETGSLPCPLPIEEFDKIWQTTLDLWPYLITYHQGK